MAQGTYQQEEQESDLLSVGIQAAFGAGIGVTERSASGGGCINQCSRVCLSDGTTVFVKENTSAIEGLFRKEAQGLSALKTQGGPAVPAVPAVIWTGSDSARQILILEYIESSSKPRGFFYRFGAELSRLHRGEAQARFGFDDDNHIGSSVQHNPWTATWVDFFTNARLVPQVKTAVRKGRIGGSLARGMETLYAKLPSLLPEPEHPSLIHGDLWGGNYLCGPGGQPVLIDPAVSYSHREAELAMTRLFGGFPAEFYSAYNEEDPLEPGYRDREDLYNLYHVLNHLNIFGESYIGGVISVLKKYGCL